MIYVFLADGFEEVEALTVVDLLRRVNLEVNMVGVGSNRIVGTHGITVMTDIEEKDVRTDKIEAIVLPGGIPGTLNLEKSQIVTACINYCNDNGKYIAAICAAPSILGHLNLLKSRKVTCFPGFEQELYDADVSDDYVCKDGNIITAKGAGVAVDFSLKIIESILGPETAEKIRTSIQCREKI